MRFAVNSAISYRKIVYLPSLPLGLFTQHPYRRKGESIARLIISSCQRSWRSLRDRLAGRYDRYDQKDLEEDYQVEFSISSLNRRERSGRK